MVSSDKAGDMRVVIFNLLEEFKPSVRQELYLPVLRHYLAEAESAEISDEQFYKLYDGLDAESVEKHKLIQAGMAHPSNKVRSGAVTQLPDLPSEVAKPLLAQALLDPDDKIRGRTIYQMNNICELKDIP